LTLQKRNGISNDQREPLILQKCLTSNLLKSLVNIDTD